MIKKILACFLTTAILFSLVSCKKNSNEADNPEKSIDLGIVEENIYKNDFFNLSIHLPKDWNVISIEEFAELTQTGANMVKDDGSSKKEEMIRSGKKALADTRIEYLLIDINTNSASVSPIGSYLIAYAINLKHLPGIRSSDDYLTVEQKRLKNPKSQLPYNLDKPIYKENLGGKDFSVLEVNLEKGSFKLIQRYYAAIINDYLLCFMTTSISDQDTENLQDTLNSISFK